MKLLHQYEKIDKQLIIFLELGPGKNGDLWYFSMIKLKRGDVLLTTDYKIYIVGAPVVNLKLKWGDVLLATDYKIYNVRGTVVNLKLKWGDELLATDYKIYIVGGPVVNL